ncbi:MAG: CcoQ/FixQ family Cbb3-type cytochrome c oxidase assembly chaperone [Bacteroidetes bacterium]|nr:MAG: CcoQ/FixQ family Cbb3-type cytochrome c oxidase assembly chaperone [Bacteroidota bacterium]MBL1146049.1 CcoQ/FixQ family Cbb3-type cytochrome c oxidase assembly chaperone [Bacteroidota bacterium]NOG58843.1 CcoQ/FixQ family Cbb3-type cytochrome c oxidase assembly chaperone [Bacteroidota bacterium]
MFTSGRIAFIIFFLILFIGYLIYAYRKDIKKNPTYFKGSYKIILALIGIYLCYFILTRIFY